MSPHPPHAPFVVAGPVAAARSLAVFFLAGGVWTLGASALIPGFAGQGPAAALTVAVGVLLIVACAAFWRHGARVPRRLVLAAAPVAVPMTGALNLATEDTSTGSQLFLLWPVIFAASFLSGRLNVVVLAEVLVVEGVVLGALQPAGAALADTLALGLAFAVAGIAVFTFRTRAERLLEALGAQAREDSLTGLPNRRAFDDALGSLSALSHRTGEPLSLVSVDVDLFKEVNDTHGHAGGDQVLRAVAAAMRDAGREADVVARVGGDEFAMLLPSCPYEDAVSIGRRLRELVSARTAAIGAPACVSVGVASMPLMAASAEALAAAADAALYARKTGREREPAPAPS